MRGSSLPEAISSIVLKYVTPDVIARSDLCDEAIFSISLKHFIPTVSEGSFMPAAPERNEGLQSPPLILIVESLDPLHCPF